MDIGIEPKDSATQPSAEPPSRRRVSRRAVLGSAVAVGAGVAVLRISGLDRKLPLPWVAQKLGTDWVSPLDREPARVAHLLRRATFGASPADLEAATQAGYNRTVDRLLETKPTEPPPLPGGDEASRATPLKAQALQQWWVDHILKTPTPFAERMTLFWHGHFTSDHRKVTLQHPFIYWQNLTWRKMALTDLGSMLMRVTIDPAMLRYLDLSTSTGHSPNENYSRELMELFTMGPGNFTEDDVRAAAMGLAGWREPRPAGVISGMFDNNNKQPANYVAPPADESRVGIFEPKRAYSGLPVAFLGRTGPLDTQGVLDRILAHPATAPFVVGRVLQHFVTPKPDGGYVRRLADRFRASKYDVKSLMRDVFMSPEFVVGSSYRALVKDPTEYMIHTLRAVQAPQLSKLVPANAMGMGQVLFDPPDVGGWPSNEAWVSSNTVVARINFVSSVLAQAKKLPSASAVHQLHLDGILSPRTTKLLSEATTDAARWRVVLFSPEFQLK